MVDEINSRFDTAHYFRILSRRLPAYVKNVAPRSLFLVVIPPLISPEDARLQASIEKHIPEGAPVVFIAESLVPSSYKSEKKLHHSYEETMAHIRRQLHNKISTYYPSACIPIYTHTSTYAVQDTVNVLLEEAYHAILQLWRNHATMGALGPRWIRNIWKNISLPLRDPSVKALKTGLPMVDGYACIVGAGPSLNTQVLKLLQRHRNKLILIACDTALSTLHCNGLIPDICVVLESQYYNIRDFIPPPGMSVHLLCDITAHPTTMRIFSKRTLFCTEFANLSFFKRIAYAFEHLMPALGSVGVAGVHIAMNSSAQGIFCAGLDFAFYKGKSHCLHAPSYTTHMATHVRCNPWQSATAHFLNKNIYPLENAHENVQHSSKVSDKTLSSYAKECNNMLQAFTKNHNTRKIYEIYNQQSMLSSLNKTHTMEYYDAMLAKAKPATLEWKQHVIEKDVIRTILTQEMKYALYVSDAMTNYKQRGLTPPCELWDTHLDFYACTLFEDAYSIRSSMKKGDAVYWKEKMLYEKIQRNAQRVVHDIRTVFKDL